MIYERCPYCEEHGYLYCHLYPHAPPRISMSERIVERTVQVRVLTGGWP